EDHGAWILHVGDPETYAAGHVPGARLITPGLLQRPRGTDPSSLILELPDAPTLKGQLEQLCLARDSRVVVVFGKDEFAGATRVVFTLDAAGFGDRVALLDGGQPEWVRRGHALATEVPTVAHTTIAVPKLKPRAVDVDTLQREARDPRFVVLDARLPEFYSGAQRSRYPSGEAPAGHLPGAKNLPFSDLLTPTLTLKSDDELRALFAQRGLKKGDEAAIYCHIGQQASAVLFAARLIGVDASLYDGSFQEWTQLGRPVETAAAR
ncbi:sulfurtransferase, partial [bacterium]